MKGFKGNWSNGFIGKAAVTILISVLVGCSDREEGGQISGLESAAPKKRSTGQQTEERDLCSHR